IASLEERHAEAAQGRIARDPRSLDAAAYDDEVVTLQTLRSPFRIAEEATPWSSAGESPFSGQAILEVNGQEGEENSDQRSSENVGGIVAVQEDARGADPHRQDPEPGGEAPVAVRHHPGQPDGGRCVTGGEGGVGRAVVAIGPCPTGRPLEPV